jgi:hypothetical protein
MVVPPREMMAGQIDPAMEVQRSVAIKGIRPQRVK